MTSGIRFESSLLLDEQRQGLKEAREQILEKAKKKYEREERKKEESRKRGEDKWILPSVDSRLTKESEEMSVKKKKQKKEKKKKKKKKKSKDSSSDNSEEEDNWVEAPVPGQNTVKPVIKGPTMPQRESWMEAPLDLLPLTSRQEIRDRQKEEKDKEEKKESVIEQMGQHAKELNPYWKDGGEGLPIEEKKKSKPVSNIGDGGAEWLKKSYLRVKEQAKAEGRNFEELAAERWGSLAKIEKMIADADKKSSGQTNLNSASRHRLLGQGDRNRSFRRPSPERSHERSRERGNGRLESDRNHNKDKDSESDIKSKNNSNERRTFQRPSSPSDRASRHSSSRSRDSDRPSGRDSRFQRPSSPSDSRDSSSRSEGSDRPSGRDSRFQRPSSPSDGDSRYSSSRSDERDRPSGRDTRFQRTSSPSDRDSRYSSSRSKGRERDANRYSASKFQRPSPDSDDRRYKSRRSKSRSPSDKRRFRRPSPDSDRESRSHSRSRSPVYRNRRDNSTKSDSMPRWKKKKEVENSATETRRDQPFVSSSAQSPSRNSESRKRNKSSSSSEDSSASSSSSESESSSNEKPVAPPPPPAILSEAEMNALAAKLLKAEIMGDESLAEELKLKLEGAREAKKNAPPPTTVSKPSDSNRDNDDDDDSVLLTRTTRTGLVIPVSERKHPKEHKKGRKRQKKVSTHEDGERKRYFDDDDKLDLKTMVEREKMGTAEDQNSMFARLAGRTMEKTDDDYQVDDVFISKAARQQSEAMMEEKDKHRAIMEHQKMSLSISKCQFCFDKIPKHLIIAIGKKSYLSLPQHKPLTPGHCLIIPMMHSPAVTAIDEDVWLEMQEFRKTLCLLFREKDEDCVFMETSMFLKRHPHTYIECVPLERETGDLAPIYFKKAIQDTETEWAQNKKVVDLSKKDIRHSVPKGFPYFAVDFGLQGGFAHVIEDEHRFPTYFGKEIVGGMIDASHRLWKNPPKESFDEQRIRVLEFSDWWKPHDWTQNIS